MLFQGGSVVHCEQMEPPTQRFVSLSSVWTAAHAVLRATGCSLTPMMWENVEPSGALLQETLMLVIIACDKTFEMWRAKSGARWSDGREQTLKNPNCGVKVEESISFFCSAWKILSFAFDIWKFVSKMWLQLWAANRPWKLQLPVHMSRGSEACAAEQDFQMATKTGERNKTRHEQ